MGTLQRNILTSHKIEPVAVCLQETNTRAAISIPSIPTLSISLLKFVMMATRVAEWPY
jgi:hypothetical protein